MAEITLVNVLPIPFHARDSVERAVRLAFQDVPGGPWTVTLMKQTLDPERFSVQASAPGSVTCTSFADDASDREIASGLRIFATRAS